MFCAWLNIFLFYCLLIRNGKKHSKVNILFLVTGRNDSSGRLEYIQEKKINRNLSVTTIHLRYCVQTATYSGQTNPSIKRVLSSSQVKQRTVNIRHKIDRNRKYEVAGMCGKLK
jgi:hypothetical protein